MTAQRDRLAALPSVDALLRRPEAPVWLERFPRRLVVEEVQAALEAAREAIRRGEPAPADWGAAVEARLGRWERPSLEPVINASGVILHTNLGRAPLAAAALAAIARTAGRYSNLEYDLAAGRRGRRDAHAGELLERLLGAPAIVVNNNAAALFLALHELAADGETIVSRGELIEIGDGFRIPEILARSGSRLREVGATNRTRLADYRAAVGPETRLLLRVHPSNFRIVGFSSRPTLAELVALGREAQTPVFEDLGSGCFYNLEAHGLDDEPTPAASLRAGVDLVAFSGDKLLGGPQAGVLAGRPELVGRLRRNPLFRALRADKLVYAALAETLRATLLERWDELPALEMLRLPLDEIRRRAEGLRARLAGWRAEVAAGESLLGGGSTPERSIPTVTLALEPPAEASLSALERLLRNGAPPVVARVERNRLLLDLRTVFPDQDEALAAALASARASLEAGRARTSDTAT